jgi:hypothetical protein
VPLQDLRPKTPVGKQRIWLGVGLPPVSISPQLFQDAPAELFAEAKAANDLDVGHVIVTATAIRGADIIGLVTILCHVFILPIFWYPVNRLYPIPTAFSVALRLSAPKMRHSAGSSPAGPNLRIGPARRPHARRTSFGNGFQCAPQIHSCPGAGTIGPE